MAQETLTVEYTLKGVEGVRHELKVRRNLEEFELTIPEITSIKIPEGLHEVRRMYIECNSLTNISLPDGMSKLRSLVIGSGGWYGDDGVRHVSIPSGLVQMGWMVLDGNLITNLSLPVDFGKDVDLGDGPAIATSRKVHVLSIDVQMREFEWRRSGGGFNTKYLNFPSAKEMVKNMRPDSDGIYRIKSTLADILGGGVFENDDGTYRIESNHPVTLEIRSAPNPLTITRKADGLELTWIAGTLQHALLVTGPWVDVPHGDDRRHFIRSPHPYGFFRIKP